MSTTPPPSVAQTDGRRIFLFHIIALVTALVWSTTFVATKTLLLAGLSPEAIFLYRFMIAYAGILLFSHKTLFAKSLKDEVLLMLTGISGGSLYFWTENTALRFTFASNVSIIIAITPLLTMGLAAIWLHKKLTPTMIWGSLVALCGVVLVVLGRDGEIGFSPLGDFLTFLAALCWAVYSILMKVLGTKGYDTLFVTRKIFFYGLLTMGLYFPFSGCSMDFHLLSKPYVLTNILFLGIIASLICYAVWNRVLEVLGPDKATNYIYLNPLGAVTTAVIILHEPLTLSFVLGGLAVIFGVIMVEKSHS